MKKILFTLLLIISSYTLNASERIVSLAPSINEIVFALGLGDEVVANTMFCNYPEQSKSKLKIGGYSSISIEKILSVKPTVVVGQNYDEKLHRNLRSLGIQTKVYETDTMDDIKNTILDLGTYLNKEENSKKIVSDIDNGLKDLGSIIDNQKILVVISPNKNLRNQIYVAGNYLYFEDMIKASGNKNAYISTSKSQPVVNVEKIIKLNPDIIVLLAPFYEGKDKELALVKNSWAQLPINAAKNGNIYAVDKEYAGIPSHRVVDFMKDFKEILKNVRNKRLQ